MHDLEVPTNISQNWSEEFKEHDDKMGSLAVKPAKTGGDL